MPIMQIIAPQERISATSLWKTAIRRVGALLRQALPGGMQMMKSDIDYYSGRLAAERMAAVAATHPAAARCHQALAESYELLIRRRQSTLND